jgi:hypothetical protein
MKKNFGELFAIIFGMASCLLPQQRLGSEYLSKDCFLQTNK